MVSDVHESRPASGGDETLHEEKIEAVTETPDAEIADTETSNAESEEDASEEAAPQPPKYSISAKKAQAIKTRRKMTKNSRKQNRSKK